jgi:hypothetical protein
MTVARFIIAVGILLFAAFIAVMNWRCVITTMRNKKRGIDRHHSTVPVASVVLTGLACMVYPGSSKLWMLSVPMLDIGNWAILCMPVLLIREMRKKRSTQV